jgi:hypothetical protein
MRRFNRRLAVLAFGVGGVLAMAPAGASADPNDPSQVRTMVCDNGLTVEAVIHRSNTKTLHVTTTTENFVIKFIERDGVVLLQTPGFADVPMVTCETVEFDLTVAGFFTPRGDQV